MYLDEKIVLQAGTTDSYWISCLNPDWSLIGSWSSSSTLYKMLAYYDITDLTYDYEYYAETIPWIAISTALWRCFRIQNNKSWQFISKTWAWTLFNNLWDETSVKALTYN
jgi:hypothetical protein